MSSRTRTKPRGVVDRPGGVPAVRRLICALAVTSLSVIGLSACGGIAGDAVVAVNGTPITKATFDHWMHIAASPSSADTGGKTVVPEPPDYATCIANLAASASKLEKGKKTPDSSELKSRCEQRYKALESSVLDYLISADWVIDEGTSLGIKLSDAEVKHEFVKETAAAFPQATKFRAYLRSSGESVSDVLLSVKLRLLGQRIEQKLIDRKPAKQRQAAFDAFVSRFRKKWKAKTECRPGYIVEDCRQYKAPAHSTSKR
jgi:hypothetical protein